jgi:hypothetical protein
VRFGAKPQRFSAPEFPTTINSSIQPPSLGRNCIQIDPSDLDHAPGGRNPMDDPADSDTKTDENCLFLDLYVPKSVVERKNTKPVPAVVWIYGGAFAFGSKDQLGPLYTGQTTLRQSRYRTIFVIGTTGSAPMGGWPWITCKGSGSLMLDYATKPCSSHGFSGIFLKLTVTNILLASNSGKFVQKQ